MEWCIWKRKNVFMVILLVMRFLKNWFIFKIFCFEARNIFLADGDRIKIGGFGLANLFQDDSFFIDQQSSFSIRWIAPEIPTKKQCTTKSDVWSFSILLYEIITHGIIPYSQFLDNEIIPLILDGYRLPKVLFFFSYKHFCDECFSSQEIVRMNIIE